MDLSSIIKKNFSLIMIEITKKFVNDKLGQMFHSTPSSTCEHLNVSYMDFIVILVLKCLLCRSRID